MNADSYRTMPLAECLHMTFDVLRTDYPALALAARNAGGVPTGLAGDEFLQFLRQTPAPLCHAVVAALADLNHQNQRHGTSEQCIALRRLLLIWMEWELLTGARPPGDAPATARATAAPRAPCADHRQ